MNDLERYEFCMRYARTMMMMAKILKEKYGKDDTGFQMYVRQGIESCKLAQKFKQDWEDDNTIVFKLVA